MQTWSVETTNWNENRKTSNSVSLFKHYIMIDTVLDEMVYGAGCFTIWNEWISMVYMLIKLSFPLSDWLNYF